MIRAPVPRVCLGSDPGSNTPLRIQVRGAGYGDLGSESVEFDRAVDISEVAVDLVPVSTDRIHNVDSVELKLHRHSTPPPGESRLWTTDRC